MNTTQNPRPDINTEDPALRQLVEEICRVSNLISSSVAEGESTSEAVLLGQLVHGLDIAKWEKLASEHGLCSWLALPLNPEAAQSLTAIQAMLDQLIYQRDHDPLTGLANRRLFNSYLASELERAKRNYANLSLAILDLDNFKHINDSYGHPCGDHVLREVGGFLKSATRTFELVSRLGGDEFAIVLPGTTGRQARSMLDRVCSDLNKHQLQCENSPKFTLNFSAGVVSVGPEQGYVSLKELVDMADNALYDAKRKGKNQVCIAAGSDLGTTECMVLSHEKQFLFSYAE